MSTQPLIPDDIEGLPPGATLKSVQGLPPGAVLKAIQKQPAAPTATSPQPEGFFHSFLSQLGGLLNSPGPGSVPTPQIAAGMAENFMDAMGQANKPVSPTTGLPLADPLGAIKGLHTTAALLTPFGGQSLEKGLEQLESQNYRGAAGTALGAAVPLAVGGLIKPKAPAPSAEVLPKHVEALTGLIEDKAGTVDPHETASAALPTLRETAVRMKVDPSKLEGREAGQTTLKVAEQAVRDTQNEFNTIKKPYNAVLVDQKPIADAYRSAITPELLANEPKVARALEKQAQKFDQPAPLEQVNQFRTRMNNQLNAFEQRGTTAQIMSDIETKASKAAANAARDVEYNTVGRLSGLDPEYIRGLKQREGSLIEAKTSLEKEYNRASGQQGEAASKTLREKVANTYPSPRGIKHVGLKELIGPKPIDSLNLRLKQMFEGMGSASELPSYEQVQPPAGSQGEGGPSGPVPSGEASRGIKAPQQRTFLRTTKADVKDYYNYRFDQLREEFKGAETPEAKADVQRRMVELDQTQRSHPTSEGGAQIQPPAVPRMSDETAPIYDQQYEGPISITELKRIKNSSNYPATVREAAQAVHEATTDSAMPIMDAMRLNGTDALAKALGGKLNKTINAQVKPPVAPVVENGQITQAHVDAENAFYTQARAELGAQADPMVVLRRAQALKQAAQAKGAPPPTTPVPPTARPTLTQKMQAQPLPSLRRVQAPVKASGGPSEASATMSPGERATALMLLVKQGKISPEEADSKIQRLVGSGGRRTIRRPAAPE